MNDNTTIDSSSKQTNDQAPHTKGVFAKLRYFLNRVNTFFQDELWLKDTSALPKVFRLPFALVRIIMIVLRGFSQDNCTLQASALTYITLVSLVPILAIMFSFTKGMGMQHKIFAAVGVERYEIIDETTGEKCFNYRVIEDVGHEENTQASPIDDTLLTAGMASKLPQPMQEALLRIFQYVENTNFTALGLVGSVMLLFTVIFSMAKLEKSFNLIWGVRQERTFLRKCSEYLVVIILFPIIFLLTTSLNSLLFSNKAVQYLQEHYGQIAYLLGFTVKIISLLVLLCAFALFFMFMPNTKVKVFPAFIAGSVSFILWGGVQWLYLKLQVGLTNFNSIYGTFAVVPFFLAWLYANWSIILLGGELSFAIQNHKTIHLEKTGEHAGGGTCIVIGQLLLYEICRNFHHGNGATDVSNFAMENNIPARILTYVLETMAQAGIVVKTADTDIVKYLPGKDIALLSPADVEEAFRQQMSLNTRSYIRDLPEALRKEYESIYDMYHNKLAALTFNKLLQK